MLKQSATMRVSLLFTASSMYVSRSGCMALTLEFSPSAATITSSESASPFTTLRACGYTLSSRVSRNLSRLERRDGSSCLYFLARARIWVFVGTSLDCLSFSMLSRIDPMSTPVRVDRGPSFRSRVTFCIFMLHLSQFLGACHRPTLLPGCEDSLVHLGRWTYPDDWTCG